MDLFSRFKKDYFNYLLSIILPALIMGLSIPVLKHLLGAKGYGSFSIWFNGVLICAAVLSGWITQSILRLYNSSEDKILFSQMTLRISFRTQMIIALPVLLIVWFINKDILLAVLFVLALFTICFQFPVMAISQSGFLSKKNIYSETIRAVSYISLALLLLYLTGLNYIYSLFIAVILSYLFSVIYLYRQIESHQSKVDTLLVRNITLNQLIKKFLTYGAPLSLWFVFAYLATYIDKLFIIKNFGLAEQGNYQAIFDLLSRTLVVIVSPVATSLFPLLTLAYKQGEREEINKLIRKIILFEVAGFVSVSVLYWWFGADLVFNILKVENNNTSRWMGFLAIAGTFTWLIAIVVHKKFELRMQSLLLLGMITMAFLIQLMMYLIFQDRGNILLYPLGYLVSGIVYIILIVFSDKTFFRKYIQKKPVTVHGII